MTYQSDASGLPLDFDPLIFDQNFLDTDLDMNMSWPDENRDSTGEDETAFVEASPSLDELFGDGTFPFVDDHSTSFAGFDGLNLTDFDSELRLEADSPVEAPPEVDPLALIPIADMVESPIQRTASALSTSIASMMPAAPTASIDPLTASTPAQPNDQHFMPYYNPYAIQTLPQGAFMMMLPMMPHQGQYFPSQDQFVQMANGAFPFPDLATASGSLPPMAPDPHLRQPQPQRVAPVASLTELAASVPIRRSARKRPAVDYDEDSDHDDDDSDCQPPTSKRPRQKSSSSESDNTREARRTMPHYKPLEARPRTWGRERRFKYIYTGELEQRIRLTPKEMYEFIFENPRRLTLRIGRTPMGANDRYGRDNGGDKGGAMKCRFACCLDKNGTMEKGTYRVVLDEFRGTHPHHDPFANAGYVHLWCLERWLDLPSIINAPNVNVVVDDGLSLPIAPGPVRDRQQASVRFGSDLEIGEAQAFVDACVLRQGAPDERYPHCTQRGRDAATTGDLHGPYEGTLSHRCALLKSRDDKALHRHSNKRPKAQPGARSRFMDHLYDLAVQYPHRTRTRRPSGQKSGRSAARRRASDVEREHARWLARTGGISGRAAAGGGQARRGRATPAAPRQTSSRDAPSPMSDGGDEDAYGELDDSLFLPAEVIPYTG